MLGNRNFRQDINQAVCSTIQADRSCRENNSTVDMAVTVLLL